MPLIQGRNGICTIGDYSFPIKFPKIERPKLLGSTRTSRLRKKRLKSLRDQAYVSFFDPGNLIPGSIQWANLNFTFFDEITFHHLFTRFQNDLPTLRTMPQ